MFFFNVVKTYINKIIKLYIFRKQLLYKKTFSKIVNISEDFYDWDNIINWIEILEKRTKIFQKIVIAKTYESRDIFFLKISLGGKKPVVFIVGGEDGLDWISSSLILNLFSEFVEHSDFKMLLNVFDFYLLPILNPDGFVYTKNQVTLICYKYITAAKNHLHIF